MSVPQESIDHWRNLAKEELADIAMGIHDKTNTADIAKRRAEIYERTAQALEIERATGVAVCVCHHITYEECRKLKIR